MLAATGDSSFRLGTVHAEEFAGLVRGATGATVCSSSCLESIPGCCECAYSPYCGTCPVINLAESRSVYPRPGNYRCRIVSGMLDQIFEKLRTGALPSTSPRATRAAAISPDGTPG